MSTLADFIGDMKTLTVTSLATVVPTIPKTNIKDMWSRDFAVPKNEIAYQVSAAFVRMDRTADSNTVYMSAECTISLHYFHSVGSFNLTEQIWNETNHPAYQKLMLDPNAWGALSSVYEVIGGPEQERPEKTGAVISGSITGIVLLNP
jgi:hypothetical protein